MEVIITNMKIFYKLIDITSTVGAITPMFYKGNVVSGIKFQGHKGQMVKSRKDSFKRVKLASDF